MSLLIFLIYSPKSCYNFFIIGQSKKKKKNKNDNTFAHIRLFEH